MRHNPANKSLQYVLGVSYTFVNGLLQNLSAAHIKGICAYTAGSKLILQYINLNSLLWKRIQLVTCNTYWSE
jgi:hypothetical protein